MNSIKQNAIGYNINPNKVGFKSDVAMGPLPGMFMPVSEDNLQNSHPQEENVLPDLYYMPENYTKPKTFVDKLKKVDIMGLIHPWFEHPLLMLGAAAGISMSVDAFDKSCNKEYEKSIVGKAANFGDKIQESKFVQKPGTKKFLSNIKKGWGKLKTTLMKSDIIRAMVETPSKPEFNTPKQELKNMDYRLVEKFKDLVKKFGIVPNLDTSSPDIDLNLKLNNLVLDSKEEEYIKNTFNVNKLSKAPREEAVNRILLQRIGKSEAEIASIVSGGNANGTVIKELFAKSGLTDAELAKIFKEELSNEEAKEVIKLVDKACVNLKNLRITNGRLVIPGKIQPVANVESPLGIHNRIHSKTVGAGARTETGAFMSKLVQKFHKMFTFGSNKLGVLIWITPMMVGTILNTIKADKKEKVGTAASGLINTFAWVLYFPLVVKALYALGGIQYAGMGKDKVQELEKRVNEFNAKTKLDNPNCFKTKAEYKEAKTELKKRLSELRKVENQNFLTKTLRGISKFTKSDLLKIESYQGGSKAGNLLRRIPNKMKDLFLGRGRMLIFLLAAIPFVDKIIEKITTKIFGKGYDEFKENDIRDEKEKQEEYTMKDLRSRLIELQNNKLNPVNKTAETSNQIGNLNNIPTKTVIPASMIKMAELAGQNSNIVSKEESMPTTNDIVKSNSNAGILKDDEAITVESAVVEPEKETKSGKKSTSEEQTESMSENTITDSNPDESPNLLITPQDNLIPESKNVNPSNVASSVKNEDNTVLPNDKLTLQKDSDKKNDTEVLKRDNYTYIPSSENVLSKNNPAQNLNKYIPAQTAAKFDKSFDNSGLEAAIKRADRAEKRALDILAGNFEHV